uniref:Uncharacterized protein n=1 Tax=Anguilla anguilla TaxID=7936 RepID=A0A0E9U2W9_ANGAN
MKSWLECINILCTSLASCLNSRKHSLLVASDSFTFY